MRGCPTSQPTPPSSAPGDVARAWRSRRGLVFLDSDERARSGISVVAAEPVEVLQGNLWKDAEMLREVLKTGGVMQAQGVGGAPCGGLFGWVGYDGEFTFGRYAECLVYDHQAGCWSGEVEAQGASAATPLLPGRGTLHFAPQMDEAAFCSRVERAQAYIAAGDIYQVNLSYPWQADWPEKLEPWDYYETLRKVSPAPYGAFLDLEGVQVMSASPECFLKMSGRHILTRPIKGTRPRGVSKEGDRHLASELLESAKERAELVMITDLERNDLGRVCEFGSVRVTDLLRLEQYAQVHHLVSTVEGVLRPEVDHLTALMECFPGGSITGAPKKRSMEIIRELEPQARGLYTGAIGYLGFNGESQFSIAIRTAVRRGAQASFHTGAGIVADSVPAQEWAETQHKALGLLHAAKMGR